MAKSIVIQQALGLARHQAGVVTWSQLHGLGISRRLIDQHTTNGQWRRIDRGTFWTAPSDPTWEAYLWSAALAGGDGAVCGRTAAYLHGFHREQRLPIEFAISRDRRLTSRPYVSFRRIDMSVRSYRSRAGLRCVGVEDTVLDLCDVATKGEVVDWITAAAQSRLTSPERLARALTRRRALGNRAMVTKLIGDIREGVQSPLEHEYVDSVERPHGLPAARRQAVVGVANEHVDNYYDGYGLVVELDGERWHPDAFRDRARDNRNMRTANSTLRYGWREITGDPCGIAAEVGGFMIGRGWPGPLQRCPACPRGF